MAAPFSDKARARVLIVARVCGHAQGTTMTSIAHKKDDDRVTPMGRSAFSLAPKIAMWFPGAWNEALPVPERRALDNPEPERQVSLPDKVDVYIGYATVPGYK